MASHYPTPRQIREAAQAAERRRDVTWGRVLFVPPALAQPHVIFDPLPFRAHEFAPARSRKAPYTR
jgi:hypothetical protein